MTTKFLKESNLEIGLKLKMRYEVGNAIKTNARKIKEDNFKETQAVMHKLPASGLSEGIIIMLQACSVHETQNRVEPLPSVMNVCFQQNGSALSLSLIAKQS